MLLCGKCLYYLCNIGKGTDFRRFFQVKADYFFVTVSLPLIGLPSGSYNSLSGRANLLRWTHKQD